MNKVLNSPRITVLMPAYNAEQFIIAAVSSILAQEFSSFKLVILDDGSNDRTPEILASFARLDGRITIYTNLSKTGILAARDKLLSYVDTEYFAWMDADDISTPDRLRKQINFLDNNAHIDIVAGSWSILGTDDKTIPYSDPEEIKAAMLVSNPFHNPVMMVRTASIQDLPFHYKDCGVKSASDFAFVTSIKYKCLFSTLSDVLYFYRVHPNQESTANSKVQRDSLKLLMCRQFEDHGVSIPQEIRALIRTFPDEKTTIEQANEIGKVYTKMIVTNRNGRWYKEQFLKKHLGISYKRICSQHGLNGLRLFIKHFGTTEVLKGKKFGFSFLADCFKE